MSAGEIILNVVLLIVGFVLLVKGADWFVDGASMIAEKLKIPPMVIGLTIVAIGTSLPEAAVSITAALSEGGSAIALGNVIGSNIANVLLILGICAIVNPLIIKKNTLWIDIPFVILITIMLLVMGKINGDISRWDGIILMLLFVGYIIFLVVTAMKDKNNMPTPEIKENTKKPRATWLLIVLIIIGGAMVVGGSKLVVDSASALATAGGMSQAFVGLTIVAIGTSLPELVTSVVATRKNQCDLAIGNIVGSNLFNILFILGLTGIVSPITFESSFIIDGLIALASMVLLWLLILSTKNKKLTRVGGIIMFTGYIAYFSYLLAINI